MEKICIDCGNAFKVNKFATMAKRCNECKAKRKHDRFTRTCETCGHIYQKSKQSRNYSCPKCKEEKLKGKTFCLHCEHMLERSCYNGLDSICIECKEKIKKEQEFKKDYKYCPDCNQHKKKYIEIGVGSPRCYECKKKKHEEWKLARRKKNVKRRCISPNCNNIFEVKHARATLAYCPECRNKREEIRRQEIERFENRPYISICFVCGQITERNSTAKQRLSYKVCDDCRSVENWKQKYKDSLVFKDGKFLKKCLKCNHDYWSEENKIFSRHICENCTVKRYHRGDLKFYKNNFSYRGIASDGHKFDSLNEMDVEEYLTEKKIKHIPHVSIGDSYKKSDQFLLDYDTHLEIDGIGRKDDIDWHGKLSLYNSLNLKYRIIKATNIHFRDNKEACFKYLDEQFTFLKEL